MNARLAKRHTIEQLVLFPEGELDRRLTDEAYALNVAIQLALRGNPRLQADELYKVFRAEAFERFERAFKGLSS